jgi:hypothetical protein
LVDSNIIDVSHHPILELFSFERSFHLAAMGLFIEETCPSTPSVCTGLWDFLTLIRSKSNYVLYE